MDTNKPKDFSLIELIIQEYIPINKKVDESVVNLLLQFMYKYVTEILTNSTVINDLNIEGFVI